MLRALGRVTMYRLVTIVLLSLVGIALLLAVFEELDRDVFAPAEMLLTLLVLVVASVVSSRVFASIWRASAHLESALITGLLLWFLYWPTSDVRSLCWLALAAVLATASKYLIAWRERHLLNPAAAGAVGLFAIGQLLGGRVSGPPATTWWVANESLLWFVLVGALLVLLRTDKLAMGSFFVVSGAVFTFWGVADSTVPVVQTLEYVGYSTPLVFFAGFMLSEPLTLAPRRAQQWILAVVAAAVFSWPLISQRLFGEVVATAGFEGTYELALLVVNVIGFMLGQRGSIQLQFEGKRPLGGDVWELTFTSRRRLRFRAGQYLELHLPHQADLRGTRRMFTIVSPPDDRRVSLGVRLPQPGSSFKRALAGLRPADTVRATGVYGDFVWPKGPQPVLLVAGGIGVTPFISQLRDDVDRDAVAVYGVPSAAQVPYRCELERSGARVVLVSPDVPEDLPAGWSHVVADAITLDVVTESVPDMADRRVYVSGPPRMVAELARRLRCGGTGVQTDAFTGY